MIWLQLRKTAHAAEFLPFDDIVDVMLHELAHNFHQDHSPAFMELLEQSKAVGIQLSAMWHCCSEMLP